jgi:ATP-dependent DNA ligase
LRPGLIAVQLFARTSFRRFRRTGEKWKHQPEWRQKRTGVGHAELKKPPVPDPKEITKLKDAIRAMHGCESLHLLHIDNDDVTKHILKKRRSRLKEEFSAVPKNVQLSPVLFGHAADVLAHVKEFEFEGVVAKRLDSIYVPGRTSQKWQKQKTQKSDDFLVGGYIPGRYGVEQLVIGESRGGDFYFVDSVKNGFVPSTRQRVFEAIKGKEMNKCPFVNLPEEKGRYRMDREKMATVRWLQPRIVAEIAFNERTPGEHLRHSKFLRLRDPADVRTRA